jgi:CxxC-x17-CxxC domain-containing protein
MDRARIPENERKDFYLYVDEFQNFATESFASILSEARKYRLNLTIAHQYITQMEEPVRDAVFGNAGTLVTFRVGAADAEFMEKEFEPQFTPTDLVNLDKFNAYIRLMINGITSKPFSMQTISPAPIEKSSRETAIKVSRERYGRRRKVVEDKIARWSGVVFAAAAEEGAARPAETRERRPKQESPLKNLPPLAQVEDELEDITTGAVQEEIKDLTSLLAKPPQAPERPEKASPTASTSIICARCGKRADVPFVPEPGRPVYCRECFAIVKNEEREERMRLPAARTAPPRPSPPPLPHA